MVNSPVTSLADSASGWSSPGVAQPPRIPSRSLLTIPPGVVRSRSRSSVPVGSPPGTTTPRARVMGRARSQPNHHGPHPGRPVHPRAPAHCVTACPEVAYAALLLVNKPGDSCEQSGTKPKQASQARPEAPHTQAGLAAVDAQHGTAHGQKTETERAVRRRSSQKMRRQSEDAAQSEGAAVGRRGSRKAPSKRTRKRGPLRPPPPPHSPPTPPLPGAGSRSNSPSRAPSTKARHSASV